MAASIAISTAETTAAVRSAPAGKSVFARLVERFTASRIASAREEIARSPHLARFEARDAMLLELAGRD